MSEPPRFLQRQGVRVPAALTGPLTARGPSISTILIPTLQVERQRLGSEHSPGGPWPAQGGVGRSASYTLGSGLLPFSPDRVKGLLTGLQRPPGLWATRLLCQAPLSVGLPGMPFPAPGDLPDPGLDSRPRTSRAGSWGLHRWATREAQASVVNVPNPHHEATRERP